MHARLTLLTSRTGHLLEHLGTPYGILFRHSSLESRPVKNVMPGNDVACRGTGHLTHVLATVKVPICTAVSQYVMYL